LDPGAIMDTQEPQLASSERHTATEVPRAAIIKRIAVALGGLSAAGAAAAGLASASGSSGSSLSSRDREVLEFALKFEQLQAAFYGQALKAGKLTGQIKQFAEVVGGEERAHLHYLEQQLGGAGGSPPTFTFGDATTNNAKFIAAAVTIEDTGLAAYNGQAGNMSSATLRSVARVISFEARHAAWARSLAGKQPAPVPADVPITASAALKSIKPYLG
jgi:rubrerythrin